MTEENRSTEIVHAADAPTRRQKVGGAFKRISVAALAVGLAGGIALPAVAGSTGMQQDSSLASSFAGQEQNYEVSPELEAALALVPDTIDATSREELEAMQARIEADAKAEEEEGIEVDEEAPSNDAPPVSDNAGGIVGIAQKLPRSSRTSSAAARLPASTARASPSTSMRRSASACRASQALRRASAHLSESAASSPATCSSGVATPRSTSATTRSFTHPTKERPCDTSRSLA